MPRAGSMWAFNITRELLRADGALVVPEEPPQNDPDMILFGNHIETFGSPQHVAVLKTHTPLDEVPAFRRAIVPQRDLRDALVSIMRFTRIDFVSAVNMTAAAAQLTLSNQAFGAERALPIEYTDIAVQPAAVIVRIADFLELEIADATVDKLVDSYSKEKIKKRMSTVEKRTEKRIKRGKAGRNEVVTLDDGSYRIYDTKTGFQSGHISDYEDGGWRELFDSEQQTLIERELNPWLEKLGYPI